MAIATVTPTGKYLRYSEVSETLGVSLRTVRKLTASRQLKAVRIGRCVRIPTAELAKYCDALPDR